jgi:hypothetical protein
MVSGAPDPVPVNSTIKVQHRIQINVGLRSPTSPTPVTTRDIANNLPGGGSAWDKYRIIKIDAWGNDVLPISLQMTGNAVAPVDGASFTDWGSPGARRAELHIMPAFSFRSAWQPLSGADTQFSMWTNLASANDTAIVNITLELQTERISDPQLILPLMV